MTNLISMTDFVLEQEKEFDRANVGFAEFTNNVCNYAKFLKQPLGLWMFVPIVRDVIIEAPFKGQYFDEYYPLKLKQYEEAKERCLFEGFDACKDGFLRIEEYILYSLGDFQNETIEDILHINPKLTETAIKQIGL